MPPQIHLRLRADLPPDVAVVVNKVRRNHLDAWTEAEANVVADFVGFRPTEPYPGSASSKWSGVCQAQSHLCSPSLKKLLAGRGPCFQCGRIAAAKALEGRGLMAITQVVEQRGGEVTCWRLRGRKLHIDVRYWGCNHEVQNVPPGNIRWEQGCGVCNGKVVQRGVNDLMTVAPEIAAQMAPPFDPALYTRGSSARSKSPDWQCSDCNHRWRAPVSQRAQGRGCPACANRTVVAGVNDLATTHKDLAVEMVHPLPTTVTAGSSLKAAWKCSECAHEWKAVIYSRTGSGKVGCPSCAPYGYNFGEPGALYVVFGTSLRNGERLLKVGIANVSSLEARLRDHTKQGLNEVACVLAWQDGRVAPDVEALWKKPHSGVRSRLPKYMRATRKDLIDGFSEAVLLLDESIAAVIELLTLVRRQRTEGLIRDEWNALFVSHPKSYDLRAAVPRND